jgi:hypothetical protein
VWEDLCNMLEKRRGNAELFGCTDIHALSHKLRWTQLDDVPIIWSENGGRILADQTFNDIVMKQKISERDPFILQLLEIGCGKMSLCGGAVLEIIQLMTSTYTDTKTDFDLFFHCNMEDADEILEKCLNHIENTKWQCKYIRSQSVITCNVKSDKEEMKIQFIKRLYHTKDQVLLGFDMAGCQYGWNPIDGFFTTLQGLFAFVTGAYPVDSTQFTSTYNTRLNKYIRKGFTILLPGLDEDGTPFENDKCVFFVKGSKVYEMRLRDNSSVHMSDYDIGNSDEFTLLKYPSMFRFKAHTAKECLELGEEVLERSIPYPEVPSPCSMNKVAKLFLGDRLFDFINASIITEDKREAERIWKDDGGAHHARGRQLAIKLNTTHKWKVDNPGCQRFGKFNPLPADPRKWYGGKYKPVIIGISDDRFQAWMDCRKNVKLLNELTDDLWKLLCRHWFEAEVMEARTYLSKLIE